MYENLKNLDLPRVRLCFKTPFNQFDDLFGLHMNKYCDDNNDNRKVKIHFGSLLICVYQQVHRLRPSYK